MHAARVSGMVNSMSYIFCGGLLVSAIWDIKTKKIPSTWLYGLLIWMGLFAVYQLLTGKKNWVEMILSLLPGMVCYLCARFTKAIGEGDAWLIIGMGLCFSIENVLAILMLSFFFVALAAVILIIVKRNMKNQKIPFVPFLLCGVVLICITGGEL